MLSDTSSAHQKLKAIVHHHNCFKSGCYELIIKKNDENCEVKVFIIFFSISMLMARNVLWVDVEADC